MELETVNRLFLELSQFATATTAKEIALWKELAEVKAQRDDLISELAKMADALEHAGTRAEFHPDSEIAVLCRKAAAALRARAVPEGCNHENRTANYDHLTCNSCGAFMTDSQTEKP